MTGPVMGTMRYCVWGGNIQMKSSIQGRLPDELMLELNFMSSSLITKERSNSRSHCNMKVWKHKSLDGCRR